MKTIALISSLSVLAVTLMAADSNPKDLIKAAAKKATDSGYSWKSEMKVPEGSPGAQFRMGPTEGKYAKDGTVMVTMTRGDNKTEAVAKGEKGAIKTDEGWKSLEELAADTGGGQPARGAFMARSMRNYKHPMVQLEEMLNGTKELKQVDGAYAGDLTEDGAKQLMTMGRRPGGQAPEPKGAKGSLKVWLKDGSLAKFEYQVQGKITGRDNQEFDVDRTTTVEIKDVGTTNVQVPEEAKKKM